VSYALWRGGAAADKGTRTKTSPGEPTRTGSLRPRTLRSMSPKTGGGIGLNTPLRGAERRAAHQLLRAGSERGGKDFGTGARGVHEPATDESDLQIGQHRWKHVTGN
jgi:hypothetical protein